MSVGSYVQQKRNSGMIDILPSAVHSQALREFGQLVPKAAAAAQRWAINETLRWLRTQIAQAVGQQERIAIGAVRQRLRAYPVRGGAMRGKLWFGINALEARRIGGPRQLLSGVSVKGREYQGAFFKQVYGGSRDIWIRTYSKHFNADDYPETLLGKRSTGFSGETYNRFPLAKAKVSLNPVRTHFDNWVKQADERLLEFLKQALEAELKKYLKRTARV